MTVYTWTGASNNDANNSSNWIPSGVPATGDGATFNSFSTKNCDWNIATVANITIDSTFPHLITMNANCTVEVGLSIGKENSIKSTSATTVSFSGTPQYKSNTAYIENNVADPFADSSSRNNLRFNFTGNTVVKIDAGIYPHMKFDYGFRPEYITPTRTENKYTVSMMSIFLGGQNVAPSSNTPNADDRKMNWIIAHHSGHNSTGLQFEVKAGTINSFDSGWGTWTFQGKMGGHTFPVNGNPAYGGWIFLWRNLVIDATAGGVGSFCILPFGSILSLTNLTINEGASIKGDGEKGATIHLVNRPTINGTWGFFPIADGVYHYKGLFNLNVAFGGTGLTSVGAGRVVFGETEQSLGHNGDFTYDSASGTLSVGSGGIVIPASVISSPAANQLWVNSGDSNKLYFGSSAVGSGGGGGSSTVDVVSNVATNTILGRNDTGSGDSEELTPAEVRTMLGIEANATADQTDAEIRAAVEAATDSNVFTDADHTKLNGIEAGATADQTASEIRTLVESATDSNVFTDADHTKLNGIATGAEVNVNADWNASSGDAQILNKPTIPSQYTDANAIAAVEGEATLDCVGQIHFRAPVEVIATDPAPAIEESGRVYGMVNTGAIFFTLPAGAPAGVQYIIINTLGNDITIRLSDPNDTLNGVSNGTALATTINNGTSIVCIGDVGAPSAWYVMGGI